GVAAGKVAAKAASESAKVAHGFRRMIAVAALRCVENIPSECSSRSSADRGEGALLILLRASPQARLLRASNSPCWKTSRPYVSAGTCGESICGGRWRHRPQPPIYRAYAPAETVREPIWRRSRTDDKPPDGPQNRNEHGGEQSPATASRIAGRSRRSYRPLARAVAHGL